MNMKKLMAVVLAVVLAISAMAINVFAAEGEVVKIRLRPNGNVGTNDSRTMEYKFETPIYGRFAYLDQNNYLELKLPLYFINDEYFAANDPLMGATSAVTWYMETNLGNKVRISNWDESATTDTYKTIYVNFGAFDRDYIADGNWATVRQGSFGEITTITLTASVKIKDYNPQWDLVNIDPTYTDGDIKWNSKLSGMEIQLWTAGDDGMKDYGNTDNDEKVTGSNIYAKNCNITKGTASNANDWSVFDFVSDVDSLNVMTSGNGWRAEGYKLVKDLATPTTDANGREKKTVQAVDLVWDMTLANRAYLINAESARVVIKLALDYSGETRQYWPTNNCRAGARGATGFTNGIATYSLYLADMPMDSTMIGQSWWQNHTAYNRVAKRVGFFNVDTTMGDVEELSFDVPVELLYNPTYGLSAGVTSTFRVYAETEVPVSTFQSSYWDAMARNYDHWTKDAYIELTMPATEEPDDNTAVDVDEPTQSDTGSDSVDVDEPDEPVDVNEPVEEPADTNPPTGIVLAVLPMVIAAAAVVASKRR